MSADDDALDPTEYGPRHALKDDRFMEKGTTDNVVDL
jgi:hypothetical protein